MLYAQDSVRSINGQQTETPELIINAKNLAVGPFAAIKKSSMFAALDNMTILIIYPVYSTCPHQMGQIVFSGLTSC